MADLDKLSIVVEVSGGKEAEGQLDNLIKKLERIESLTKRTGVGRSFDDLSKKVKEAETYLSQIEGQIERAKSELNRFSTKGLDNLKASTEQTSDALRSATKQAEEFSSAIQSTQVGAVKGTEKLPAMEEQHAVQETRKWASTLGEVKEGFSAVFGTVGKVVGAIRSVVGVVREIGSIISKMASAVKNVSAGILKVATMPFAPVVKGMEAVYNSVTKVLHQIMRMVKMRLYRLIAKHIISGFTEGLSNAYQWAKATGNAFANSMDTLATSSLYLKNSLGAMASPLINILSPAIDFIIDKFVALLNTVNQVIARLTGKSTWIKALKVPQSYASGLDDATSSAKALEKELITILGIDEINPMERANDTGTGGGGGSGTGSSGSSMFTEEEISDNANEWARKLKEAWEKADFTEIGGIIADKINEALTSIPWDKVKGYAEKVGKSLATLLNGVFLKKDKYGNDLLYNVGTTISESLNTAFTGVLAFAENFKWGEIGKSIAGGINQAMATLDWTTIKDTAKSVMGGLGSLLMNAIHNLKWTGEGGIGWTIAQGLNTAITGLLSFVREIDFEETARSIGGAITDLFAFVDWDGMEELIERGIKGALSFIDTLKESVTWEETGKKIKDAIIKGFKSAMGISEKESLTSWFLKQLFGATFGNTLLGKLVGITGSTADSQSGASEYELWTGEKLQEAGLGKIGVNAILNGIELGAGIKTKNRNILLDSHGNVVGVTPNTKTARFLKKTGLDSVVAFSGQAQTSYTRSLTRTGISALWALSGTNGVPKSLTSGWQLGSLFNIPQYVKANWKNGGLLGFPTGILSNWAYNGQSGFPTGIRSNWMFGTLSGFPAKISSNWAFGKLAGFPEKISSNWLFNKLTNFPTAISSAWQRSGLTNFPESIKAGWQRSGLTNFPDYIKAGWQKSGAKNFPDYIKAGWQKSGEKGFPSYIKAGWNITKVSTAGVAGSLVALTKAMGGAFSHGMWQSIPQYATGGDATHGSMFIAGEQGAELVGHIGGRTEVLNQSQLASTMYSSVASANASQNRLLQEQNTLLRELISQQGNTRAYITTGDLIDGISQRNRRDGRTLVGVGV